MSNVDRYSQDPVESFRASKRRRPTRLQLEVRPGLELEHLVSEFYGVVSSVSAGMVTVTDFDGLTRSFPLSDTFAVDGQPVSLRLPQQRKRAAVTASGSLRGAPSRARVAQHSRLFVEGTHDAELIEKVWGDDLREAATVVEVLEGVDHLGEVLRAFKPSAQHRRAGVLVDHLVPGSKESRIARQVEQEWPHSVLVLGHPFVDVWQAVKPARIGILEWPSPPRSVEWKVGVCAALGWPHAEQADIGRAWKRILERVTTYRDVEPALSGQVEHLIDFVTVGHH